MKRVFQFGIVVSVSLLCAAVLSNANPHHAAETPRSSEAVKARLRYEEEYVKLDAEYARKLNGLREQYIKDLDAVRKKALEKDDLDEAQRLLEEKKKLNAAQPQPGMARGMVILCALIGVEDKWADVTLILRGAIQQSQLHLRPDSNPLSALPDIAPGVHKKIMIAYMLDGKPYLSLTQDDEPIDLPHGK